MTAGTSDLRILHLFANFKWTGPADPAIRCAVHLRRLGADVCFAQAAWTIQDAEHRMAIELGRARMPVVGGLELRKHFHVRGHLRDARRLRQRLDRGDFDLLHAHLAADHLTAALARRRVRRPITVVRSLYEPVTPEPSWRFRLALRETDGFVAPTRLCAAGLVERFGVDPARVLYQDPPTDPVPSGACGDLRAQLGLDARDLAIGITARIQPHRRLDLLWEVARRVVDREPRARFVLLGRGNPEDTNRLCAEPIRRLGLAGHAILPGYLPTSEYQRALGSLDVFLFLVPGSDGTCRAVREAMAHGLPVVATRRGILPDLLGPPAGPGPGLAGELCDEEPGALAAAVVRLCADQARRRALGDAGLARARGPMDPVWAAKRLLAFYARLCDGALAGGRR